MLNCFIQSPVVQESFRRNSNADGDEKLTSFTFVCVFERERVCVSLCLWFTSVHVLCSTHVHLVCRILMKSGFQIKRGIPTSH